MSNPAHDPFYSSPFGPFYRRHSPYMVQPEYRIYEMNKRLQARTEVSRPGRRKKGGEVEVNEEEESRVLVLGFAVPGTGYRVQGGGMFVWGASGAGRWEVEGGGGWWVHSRSVHRGGVHVMPKCQTFLR